MAVTIQIGSAQALIRSRADSEFDAGAAEGAVAIGEQYQHLILVPAIHCEVKLDLAVDSWDENKVLVLFANGDGTFRSPGVKFAVGAAPYQRLRAADLNGDGHPDIVTSNWQGRSLSILLGDDKENFSLSGDRNVEVPASPFGLAIGDFNGDHHPDIAVAHFS